MPNVYVIHAPDDNIQKLLDNSLGKEFMLPQTEPHKVSYSHNGDKMTIDLETKEMEWDPINPGCMTTSRLSMRFMQWFMKGYIKPRK